MGREVRTYTEAEKLAYTVIALEEGSAALEAVHGVPSRTVRSWLQDVGGIAEARRLLNELSQGAVIAARQAIAYEMIRRVGTLPDAELSETFRAMLPKQDDKTPAVAITNVQAAQQYEVNPDALAKAMLTLQQAGAQNGHSPDVIDLP